jgi:hypothetical protein
MCRLNIILVAEGAIDREGKPISAEDVKKVNFFYRTTATYFTIEEMAEDEKNKRRCRH